MEGPDDKAGRPHSFFGIGREGGHDGSKEKNSLHSHSKWEKREDTWSKTASTTTNSTGNVDLKNMSKRGLKRLRKVGLNLKWGDTNPSNESEEEHGHGVHLGSVSTADGQNGRAVEDIDWDSLTIRGTCQEVEKRYLRLTSAPDPATVRPADVLRRALEMVKSTTKSYLFKCEQLKSIRQDLTVQRIRDEFTVEVYETHARMALEAGDLPEYNQCQTQLKALYGEGIEGCSNEFAAYSLLYILFNRDNSRDLLSAMARLTPEGRRDEVVKHALAVRHALAMGNFTSFSRLYRRAPVLSPCLMDIHVGFFFERYIALVKQFGPVQ
jgi:hypothetical protein